MPRATNQKAINGKGRVFGGVKQDLQQCRAVNSAIQRHVEFTKPQVRTSSQCQTTTKLHRSHRLLICSALPLRIRVVERPNFNHAPSGMPPASMSRDMWSPAMSFRAHRQHCVVCSSYIGNTNQRDSNIPESVCGRVAVHKTLKQRSRTPTSPAHPYNQQWRYGACPAHQLCS